MEPMPEIRMSSKNAKMMIKTGNLNSGNRRINKIFNFFSPCLPHMSPSFVHSFELSAQNEFRAVSWMQLHDNILKRETLRWKINMKRLTAQFAFFILFRLLHTARSAVNVEIIIYMVDTVQQQRETKSLCMQRLAVALKG